MRTPEAPGIDAASAGQCTAARYVYCMVFHVEPHTPDAITVKVSAPWEIITYSKTAYCTDSASVLSTQCASLGYGSAGAWVFIVTKVPNAPARNVLVEPHPD